MSVVTISAAFGAGGSEIGPAVAAGLGLPFFDRAIPVSVAGRLGIPVRDAQEKDERVDAGWWRVLSSMSDVMHLGRRNAEYALDWLAEAGIPVLTSDLLGSAGRRLDFHVDNGTTSVRVLGER